MPTLAQPPVDNQVTPAENHTALSSKATVPLFVNLRYLGMSPIRVRGLATGWLYLFSAGRPVQRVDSRDAERLLRTRYFRRAYPDSNVRK